MKHMKVLVLEPDKEAHMEEIDASLEGMQKIVGGLIEPIYPFQEMVCIICNEEGKLNSMPLNRAIYSEDGTMLDIIAGTAFICGCTEDNFTSLTNEQMEHYRELFQYPQMFFRTDAGIMAVPFKP